MFHSDEVPTAFFFSPHAKRVSRSKQLMHLEEESTDQQVWPSASFCFLVHEPILFFPLSFLKLPSTGTEGKPKFSSGTGLAKLPSRAGSAGRGVLYSPPPQPVPWPCTAALSLWAKEPEEILPLTEKGLCKPTTPPERGSFAERLKGGLPCSLVLPHRQQITAHVSCGAPYTQEDIQEVRHCCSPTAKLPLEHLTVKQRWKLN